GSLLCAGSVARLAKLQPRYFDFRCNAGRRLFKGERHVVAQVSATLRTRTTPAAAAENILETEKVPQDVVKVLENRVEIRRSGCAHAGQACMSVCVIDLPFLGVAQNAVGLRALTELRFGLFFVGGIAVWMPFQRRFAVSRLNLLDRGRPRHAQ